MSRQSPGTIAKQRIMPLSYTRLFRRGSDRDEQRFLLRIGDLMGSDVHPVPLGRARMGLHLLTKLAVREGRRRVLMSPFTIPDIVTMVVLAGGEPVFYDFEERSTAASLSSVRRLVDNRTAAIIVTHYHVNEPRLEEIKKLASAHGAYLFDDCALAFGGSIGGRPIGTQTDASVFSFSSFKFLNYFWGGLATTKNAELAHGLKAAMEKWPRLTSRAYLAQAKACLRYDVATSPAIFQWLVFPLIRNRFRKSASSHGLEYVRIETDEIDSTLASRPALAAFAEWTPKLERVERWLAKRRAIVDIYRAQIGGFMIGADTPDEIVSGSCFANFPVFIPKEHCSQMARSLTLDGFDVGRALYPNAHRHPKFVDTPGESTNVDELVASTIYLPTHFGVTPDYAHALATRVNDKITRLR